MKLANGRLRHRATFDLKVLPKVILNLVVQSILSIILGVGSVPIPLRRLTIPLRRLGGIRRTVALEATPSLKLLYLAALAL
jgi:hypothetical protein